MPDINEIFTTPESLGEVGAVLNHTHQYKLQVDAEIHQLVKSYDSPNDLNSDIRNLVSTLATTKQKAKQTQSSILDMTKSIQDLDQYKKNLVLSMKILKRLQMLIISNNSLNNIIQSHNYKEIHDHFSIVKELMAFFKPYKAIDEINRLNLAINKMQNKLIDDIFIDFEDSFTNNFTNTQLIYGCQILQLIDLKYKDKLLNWFYNYQLREIKSIFNNMDEAGSIENLNRRYIFFNNVLSNIQNNCMGIFPSDWAVDLELAKLFCKLTKQDLGNQLSSNPNVPSNTLLDSLFKTLEFEKSLNEKFHTLDFDKIISKLFEPYLILWVNEQDKVLSTKFVEFFQTPKIPQEFILNESNNNIGEFMTVLKVNNIPNISNSSIEMFKLFNKILTQIIRLTNGEILVDLSKLFIKYLHDYYSKHLLPIINQSLNSSTASSTSVENIESIKYLTMVLNTADYIMNNIRDLETKFVSLIEEPFKPKVSFDVCHDWYLELITRSISNMLANISNSLNFSWRQFENNSWNTMENTTDVSNYMVDFKLTIANNVRVILPLVIREGYVRNFSDKLTENTIQSFANHLASIKPLSIVNIEQILIDLAQLKKFMLVIPLYSNPNFDDSKLSDINVSEAKISKLHVRFVNGQFDKVETLLKLLLTPTLPVDNLIENYFQIIGDSSVKNFKKILNLKDIPPSQQAKYVENFSLQLTMSNDLVEESPILAHLNESIDETPTVQAQSQPQPQQPDIRELLSSKSPEPGLPDFLKPKGPMINNIKMNNIEKNLREFALNGENQVNKFNENFKNFGKFFRKDTHE